MKPDNLNSMSAEALWRLYENVVLILTQRMTADRTRLDQRLQKIRATDKLVRPSRSHKFVPPRYRNPKNNAKTWSGRGKLPRWLSAQLRAGRKLADFLVDQSPARNRRRNA
ncbi:H-NS family nucleoid-associated regulatory protein [Bradyrhizobium sp. Cp5.3]|uniref:H-NS histone family protein n=1 Tax=Bradyrhizobium sp. Cp5.3 TaxID=443598 RepID=UPI0009FEE05B|nr:H-NS histone family protein [Bradyrhizobium sp. Cp5.3]